MRPRASLDGQAWRDLGQHRTSGDQRYARGSMERHPGGKNARQTFLVLISTSLMAANVRHIPASSPTRSSLGPNDGRAILVHRLRMLCVGRDTVGTRDNKQTVPTTERGVTTDQYQWIQKPEKRNEVWTVSDWKSTKQGTTDRPRIASGVDRSAASVAQGTVDRCTSH